MKNIFIKQLFLTFILIVVVSLQQVTTDESVVSSEQKNERILFIL
jgi:hypothetical protein